jgi:outer membrane receptor protein involved in Fe transport
MKKPLPFKKKILASLIRTAVVATVAMPAMSWAQSSDAGLRGKAPPEMQVTARNLDTGLRRTTTSAADGSYAVVGLPPGRYQVDAGPGTEKTITLTVASTASLDFTASGGAAAAPGTATLEGITVTANVLPEVKTSEIGSTVSLRQISTIPQTTRNFLEFADTVPGMQFSVDPKGQTSLRAGVQTTSAINVYIDGVGQKSYVLAGGVAGQNQSQGNPFPQLAIGEYKVITSNYKAEFDQVGSAAIVAQTKSGTNEFHGEVFGTHTEEDWRKSTPAEVVTGTKTKSYDDEFGFAVGGPIIQDQMHFFFTYEGKNYSTPTPVLLPGDVPSAWAGYLPANVRSQFGPAANPFTEDLYFGKIDWEITDRDRLELSGKLRQEAGIKGVGGTTAASAASVNNNTDRRYDLRWQHSADAWTNELLLTYENALFNPSAINGGANSIVYNYIKPVGGDETILNAGNASALSVQHKGQKGPAIQDDLTLNALQWNGDHVIKMGFKYKKVDLTQSENDSLVPTFYYDVTPAGLGDPYKVTFNTPFVGGTPSVTSKDKQYGAYIQDDWAVNDHLTLNLGVRWDYEDNAAYTDFVTPQAWIDAFNKPDPRATNGQTYMQTLAAAGVNLNNYISNGNNRSMPKNMWQPRLGFSYDLNGDEEHVIFGGAGRSYDRNLYDYLGLEYTKSALSFNQINFNTTTRPCPAGSTCVPFNSNYLSGPAALAGLVTPGVRTGEIDIMSNNLKAPYSDQFSIGMRNKVGDWNTSATVARIISKDGFYFTLGNRDARSPGKYLTQTGSYPWDGSPPGFGNLIIGQNGLETKTTQLLLSVEKPYTKDSGWSANISYTYTDGKSNGFNNISDEHYFWTYPNIANSPFIVSNGAPKHRLVAVGSMDVPWDITLTGKLTLATTLPHQGDSVNPNDPNPPPYDHFIYGVYNPPGKSFLIGGPIFGTRQFDLSAIKNFDLTHGITFYTKLDIINVFNSINWADSAVRVYSWYHNGAFSPSPGGYNPSGDVNTPMRTFKLTAGVRW